MSKQDIRNFSFESLSDYIADLGEKRFRAQQISEWIYKKNISSFDHMSNLPDLLVRKLNSDFQCLLLTVVKKQVSEDGTFKFLFALNGNEYIETVVIPTEKRMTICLSTQLGCKYGCRFCASGLIGWQRHLTGAEIVNQIITAQVLLDKKMTHVVFMGMGEPLDNVEEVLKAIHLINGKQGLGIAARRITISTCGIIPGIKRLAEENMQFELAVSLHGSSDKVRDELIPVNKKYTLKKLIQACHDYVARTNRQITFEYILLKDLTCTESAAKELSRLLNGLLCKLNLILYNPVQELSYKRPGRRDVAIFRKRLSQLDIHATMRRARGQDITAACGQLRRQTQRESELLNDNET
ncbi:MAG: 23S rRNA (adenine(2503)-C(2))-methyltransferase RlmN [Candidatus Omnitrophica bacterium]|nr:23S rRNA (adenine(2503)-C(2))-methyltransferase RlmN [Candidatus Omnitrophota bacterium]